MSNGKTGKKYLSGTLKFVGVLLTISIVLLATYVASSELIKNSVVSNLTPIVNELSAVPGANNVEIDIRAGSNGYKMPWSLRFHVFLTVEFPFLGHMDTEDVLEVLNNGVEKGYKARSNGSSNEHVIYTRSVTDSIFGTKHPVLVTLTDGDKSYTLKDDSSFIEKNVLRLGDARSILNSPYFHAIVSIFVLSTAVFAALFAFVVYKRIEKRREDDSENEQQDERKKKAKKRNRIIVASTAGVAVIAILVIKLIVFPTNQYNQAVALREAGNDAEAHALFESLGNFKNSKDICNHYDYLEILGYLDEGRPETAFYLLNNMSGYAEAEEKAAELLKENPHFGILCAAPGEEVVFGTYEQDNNTSNGPEDIEWIVLKNENGVLYAVSKYILDAKVYNTRGAAGSRLKMWLKEDFGNIAFAEIPEGFISKVGLLTQDDMSVYRAIVDQTPEWTTYAKQAQGSEKHWAGYCWWIDGKHFSSDEMSVATEKGAYERYVSDVRDVNGLRPAIIIDYLSTGIDFYSKDYYEIENAGGPTVVRYENEGGAHAGASKCGSCNGTGTKTVKWYSEGDWGETSYTSYSCPSCGGDGRK